MRRLRERWNHLRGRPTCMVCGRHLPCVGMTCVCGFTLLGRGAMEPVSRERFLASLAARHDDPS